GDVGLEVRRRQAVDPHDQNLSARSWSRLLQERQQRAPRLGLSVFVDGVLQVERDGVGLTGQRLREELGPRGGHEQLAAHEETPRAQPPPLFSGLTTAPAAYSRSISASV